MRHAYALSVFAAVLAAFTPAPIRAETVDARGLTLEMPGEWLREEPSSSMRLLQASVPGPAGAGQFTAFHFGVGGGGGVEANLQRWIAQMDLESGSAPERATFAAGDLSVHWVDASGTLKASRIGSFPETDQPGYRLFGAVVEGTGGPWYLRLVGPAETLAGAEDAFRGMLSGAKLR